MNIASQVNITSECYIAVHIHVVVEIHVASQNVRNMLLYLGVI